MASKEAAETSSAGASEPPRKELEKPLIPESEFDKIVGLVEDIFISEEFQGRHTDYFTLHCKHYGKGSDPPMGPEDLEKLTKERFRIFRTYSVETAAFLETELQRALGEEFKFETFIQEVERRSNLSTSAQPKTGQSLNADIGAGQSDQLPNIDYDYSDVIGGEIFEMLLTMKDYARFQELMVDYLEMVQGTTHCFDDLVSTRHISDDEEVES